MRLDLIRSKQKLDRSAESTRYEQYSGIRGALTDDDLIYNCFVFDDYPGDPPHARVSLTWTDAEAIIEAFIEKGHPEALRLYRARKLAGAVEEFSKNSN